MHQVAICIINFNTYEKTIECITAIRRYTTLPYKIYLLDNGSLNDSVVHLRREYTNSPDVELICSKENLGYARGNNLLLKRSQEEGCLYSVIMNNDVICLNSVIDILLDVLCSQEDVFLAGPKMFGVNGEVQATVKRSELSYRTYLKRDTILGRFFPKESREDLEWIRICRDVAQVCWVSGAIFAVKMSDFMELGYFDEFTFLYFEEYILSEKVFALGKKMVFVPQAEILHFHGASTGTGFNFRTRCENWRSEVYFWRKYQQIGQMRLWLLFAIRVLETLLFWRKEKNIFMHLINYVKYGVKQMRKDSIEA